MRIRQPIVSVLGHVDSGKTSLLDKVRGTGVQGREAGGITQHIGASFLPVETIQKICGSMYEKLSKVEHKIPGILVIDTPGHEIFTNLRSRGCSAADIAILVVDANRGFQPQTNESLKILESRKVPFVVALNKTDMISGWKDTETQFISQSIEKQNPEVQTFLDEKIYNVVTALSVLGYQSEAFYRINDYKKEIAIVPVSAKTGIGIPELFAVLVGLTQQFLKEKLNQEEKQNLIASEVIPYLFEDDFFTESLLLASSQINDFLNYIDTRPGAVDVLLEKNQFLLIDFLLNESVRYKEINE